MAPPLGRLACCCASYKWPPFLAALGLNHSYKQASKFKNSNSKFVVWKST